MGSNTFVHERGYSMKTRTLATKLPADLVEALDAVCKQLGLRKNFVIEAALKEKIEDLLDAEDLRKAVKEATGFHSWEEVKAEVDKGGRKYTIRSRSKAERGGSFSAFRLMYKHESSMPLTTLLLTHAHLGPGASSDEMVTACGRVT
jgi:hypothetical protein